ncbi:MAG: efflux RND transporter periplasmic adaptor subunit, partial [Planctomycetes bacterium]|nr:efflux RND transporter periplasmic adaptor subunit [Planctomycetota bacterium]
SALSALAILSSALALAACGKPHAAAPAGGMPPPPQVGVASPVKQMLPVVRELTGQVESAAVVELRPRVHGVVERVLVADGAEVAAGQAVLQLDHQPFDAALQVAEANLARADALLAQARQQFTRAEELMPQRAIAQQEFDDLRSTLKAVEAQRAAADAAILTARLDVGYTTIASPIAGRIGKINTTLGNLVQSGQSLLATVVGMDPIEIAFDIDEKTWHAVSARLRAAEAGGAKVRVWAGIDGESGFPHEGAVGYAENRIDPASGSMRLRARFANADRSLTPGAFARVRFEVAPERPVLVINDQALQSQLALRYVLVVGADGVTQFRPVQLGEPVGGNLHVVASGLGPDDRIVVTGLAKIFFPGMTVVPMPVSMLDPVPAPGAHGAPAEAPHVDGSAPTAGSATAASTGAGHSGDASAPEGNGTTP